MGYELHITRADFWAENEGLEISPEEWLALIEADEELTRDNRNGPYFAILETGDRDVIRWGDRDVIRWLDWFEGNINAKSPDRVLLGKMLQVAGRLGATVQGDDGETYTRPDEIPERPAASRGENPDASQPPRFMRRERLYNLLIYSLIALAIIAINIFDLW